MLKSNTINLRLRNRIIPLGFPINTGPDNADAVICAPSALLSECVKCPLFVTDSGTYSHPEGKSELQTLPSRKCERDREEFRTYMLSNREGT